MASQRKIPTGLPAITPAWLSDVLRESGSILKTDVKSFTSQPTAEAGFTGQLARLKLEYTSAEETAPASLIAKSSNNDPGLRASFHKVGFYEKEVRFYNELAPQTRLRTPCCFYAEIDRETGHSILLLEDLDHLRTIDVATGCNAAEAELVLRYLAEFHALWWNDSRLQTSSYIPPQDQLAKTWFGLYQRLWPQFPQTVEVFMPEVPLSATFRNLGDRFCHKPENIFAPWAQSPTTLAHMDVHLKNMFLDTPNSGGPPVIFDWQTYGYGRGAIDVTYFMISSVPTHLRRKFERDLLRGYHRLLMQYGVEDYSFEQCFREYQQAFFWNLLVLTGVAMSALSDPIRRPRIKTALERSLAFVEDHPVLEFL